MAELLEVRDDCAALDRIEDWLGIVPSDPATEIDASWGKARPLLAALGASVSEAVPA